MTPTTLRRYTVHRLLVTSHGKDAADRIIEFATDYEILDFLEIYALVLPIMLNCCPHCGHRPRKTALTTH